MKDLGLVGNVGRLRDYVRTFRVFYGDGVYSCFSLEGVFVIGDDFSFMGEFAPHVYRGENLVKDCEFFPHNECVLDVLQGVAMELFREGYNVGFGGGRTHMDGEDLGRVFVVPNDVSWDVDEEVRMVYKLCGEPRLVQDDGYCEFEL